MIDFLEIDFLFVQRHSHGYVQLAMACKELFEFGLPGNCLASRMPIDINVGSFALWALCGHGAVNGTHQLEFTNFCGPLNVQLFFEFGLPAQCPSSRKLIDFVLGRASESQRSLSLAALRYGRCVDMGP